MKKVFVAIALAMMSILFVGCNKELEPDANLVEKLMGRWVLSYTDDMPALTNSKIVYNYVSATEAYLSASFNAHPEKGSPWIDLLEAHVAIQGSKITVTYQPDQHTVVTHEFTVRSINDNELSAYAVITAITDGAVDFSEQGPVRFKKVKTDYSAAVLGLWEGQMVSQESEYDDGQEHRWLFNEDGTFAFYLKNEKGIWVEKDDEFASYFVAGDLLCTRWKNAGVGAKEGREWWDITAVSEDRMVWTALREKKDGTRYTAAFSMKKIGAPTQAEIEAAIVGKWMNAEMNGEPCLTNDKFVYSFLNTTTATLSASASGLPGLGDLWHQTVELDAKILDNCILLSRKIDQNKTINVEMTVTSIDQEKMHADVEASLTENGQKKVFSNDHIVYEKVKENYRKSIRGLWEGRKTSESGTEYHRWEYLEDGTYNFYLKKGEGQWVKMEDEYSEYFVAGRLLCTRWKNAGEGTQENREWWEIRSIENETMIWTGLRINELGDRYVESFSMNKVQVPTADEIMRTIKSTKWMTEKLNGEIALTNEKAVFTFFSRTQAAISASFVETLSGEKEWATQREFDYVIEKNVITLTCKLDENTTFVDEMKVGFIDDENIHCMYRRTLYQDGRTLPYPAVSLELRKQEKTPVHYGSYILGTWEGRATSDHSQYDDGQVHRWKYEGKNYVYYVKQGNNWVPSSNTENEYYVDGRLLLTRWVDNGVEYREWWEIMSLDDQTMIWGALRRDEYGDIYPASFSMTKIADLE